MPQLILHILFACLSVALYIHAPNGYDAPLCQAIGWLYLTQNLAYFLLNKKKNLVSFEFFFAVAFFFTNLAFPIFIFPHQPQYGFFWFPWNKALLTRATALAYMGYAFYMVGLCKIFHMNRPEPDHPTFKIESRHLIMLFTLMMSAFLLYAATGGLKAMLDVYSNGGNIKDVGIYSYFYVIFTLSAYLLAIFVFRVKNADWWVYILALIGILSLIILTGSRSVALSVVLILIVSWNNNIRRFKLPEILVITAIGSLALYLIVATRINGVNMSGLKQSLTHLDAKHVIDVFSDLIINNYNLLVLYDFHQTHELTWFSGMLIDLATPVPGMARHIVSWMEQPYELLCAQDLTSYLILGPDASWGLGCNMIGDAYRSFGSIGTAFCMFFIGWAVKTTYYESHRNVYAYLIYYLLVAYSIFYTRAPILFPPRMLVWSLLLFWGVSSLVKKWPNICQYIRRLAEKEVKS